MKLERLDKMLQVGVTLLYSSSASTVWHIGDFLPSTVYVRSHRG